MKILIWPGRHDPLDWWIRALTHGAGTHAAFLRHAPDQNERLRRALAIQRQHGSGRLLRGAPAIVAGFQLKGMKVHESFYPRVRTRPFTLEDLAQVEIYDLEGVTLAEHYLFEAEFNRHDGFRHRIRYPMEDLFRYAVNLPARENTDRVEELHGMFCSRYVMYDCRRVLPMAKLPLVRLPTRDGASPRDLRVSPRLLPFP